MQWLFLLKFKVNEIYMNRINSANNSRYMKCINLIKIDKKTIIDGSIIQNEIYGSLVSFLSVQASQMQKYN
jgi:hypothetical protein